jgi:integrase/recombinase XerC
VFKRKEINIKNATMYIMRHAFARHLAMRGEFLKAIQELLGHADIKTIMVYANVSFAYLNNVVAKLSY